MEVAKGNRKARANREAALMLLLGFIIAAWMKAPTELYVAFVVGIGGSTFSFMWGNAQVAKVQAIDSKSPV